MELSNDPNGILMSASKPILLLMICEELKSRKFFNTLQQLGLEDSYYQPHLDEAICACVGLMDQSDATLDFYYAVMEEHAGRITKEREVVVDEARVVLEKLIGLTRTLREQEKP